MDSFMFSYNMPSGTFNNPKIHKESNNLPEPPTTRKQLSIRITTTIHHVSNSVHTCFVKQFSSSSARKCIISLRKLQFNAAVAPDFAAMAAMITAAVTAAMQQARSDAGPRAASQASSSGPVTSGSRSELDAADSVPGVSGARHEGTGPHHSHREPNCEFDGGERSHPLDFLEELEQFFEENNTPPRAQLAVATRCLRGHAHDWARAEQRRGRLVTYRSFREALRAEFWPEDRQQVALMEIYQARWSTASGATMAEWLVAMTRRAQLLDPPLPEHQLVSCLTRHFPAHTAAALLAIPNLTLDGMRIYKPSRLQPAPGARPLDSAARLGRPVRAARSARPLGSASALASGWTAGCSSLQ